MEPRRRLEVRVYEARGRIASVLVDGTGDRCEPDSSGMTHGNSNSKEELSSEDAIEQLEYDNYLCHDPEKTLSWMSATVPMDGSCTMPIWSSESKDWHLILDSRTPSGVFAELGTGPGLG